MRSNLIGDIKFLALSDRTYQGSELSLLLIFPGMTSDPISLLTDVVYGSFFFLQLPLIDLTTKYMNSRLPNIPQIHVNVFIDFFLSRRCVVLSRCRFAAATMAVCLLMSENLRS